MSRTYVAGDYIIHGICPVHAMKNFDERRESIEKISMEFRWHGTFEILRVPRLLPGIGLTTK